MKRATHQIARVNDGYHIRKRLSNGISEVWVTKRYRVNGGKPGPFVKIDFLNTVVEHIRKEPDGKDAVIELNQTTKDHLFRMGFCKNSIEKIIDNKIGRFPV